MGRRILRGFEAELSIIRDWFHGLKKDDVLLVHIRLEALKMRDEISQWNLEVMKRDDAIYAAIEKRITSIRDKSRENLRRVIEDFQRDVNQKRLQPVYPWAEKWIIDACIVLQGHLFDPSIFTVEEVFSWWEPILALDVVNPNVKKILDEHGLIL